MGLYQANISETPEPDLRAASRVCPFSDESPNEDVLGAPSGHRDLVKDTHLGQYSRTFAGRVSDDNYLQGSSSGGLTSWLLSRLLEHGHVDSVISVGRQASDLALFGYRDMAGPELARHRKSHYYASTMADALGQLQDSKRRYALVGVPCFIRAVRALCVEKPELKDRVVFTVGLVCGHYKTRGFAESLSWQLGVAPNRIDSVDFRVKRMDRGASDYDFAVKKRGEDTWRSAPVRTLVGGNWGHSAFQPEACNFCDDVVGETADVSFGDAWLPQFTSDPRGTNIVVSRSLIADELFDEGHRRGEITVLPASPDEAIASQAGGFRHRRGGLSVRLADDTAAGLSVPRKRVSSAAASEVSARRQDLIRQRRRMAARSIVTFREAVAQEDLDTYLRAQRLEIARYRRIEHPAHKRLYLKCRRLVAEVARRALRPLRERRRFRAIDGHD
jgi:coenzyme F420-reducing hydrogenase beta subunit